MQITNSSTSTSTTTTTMFLLGHLGLCGDEEDDDGGTGHGSPPRQGNDTGGLLGSAAAAQNFSLNCWLQFLSKETSLDLHGDRANLVVGGERRPHIKS